MKQLTSNLLLNICRKNQFCTYMTQEKYEEMIAWCDKFTIHEIAAMIFITTDHRLLSNLNINDIDTCLTLSVKKNKPMEYIGAPPWIS